MIVGKGLFTECSGRAPRWRRELRRLPRLGEQRQQVTCSFGEGSPLG
jgi:hypothetical protein